MLVPKQSGSKSFSPFHPLLSSSLTPLHSPHPPPLTAYSNPCLQWLRRLRRRRQLNGARELSLSRTSWSPRLGPAHHPRGLPLGLHLVQDGLIDPLGHGQAQPVDFLAREGDCGASVGSGTEVARVILRTCMCVECSMLYIHVHVGLLQLVQYLDSAQ